MAVNPVHRILVHLNLLDTMLEHIGRVGTQHFATLMKQDFFAIRTPFVGAITWTVVNEGGQL